MLTENKVIEIYAFVDDFCKFFSQELKKHQLNAPKTTSNYHRSYKLSDAELTATLTLFHLKGYRCLKKFYMEHVCVHMKNMKNSLMSVYKKLLLRKRAIIKSINDELKTFIR